MKEYIKPIDSKNGAKLNAKNNNRKETTTNKPANILSKKSIFSKLLLIGCSSGSSILSFMRTTFSTLPFSSTSHK